MLTRTFLQLGQQEAANLFGRTLRPFGEREEPVYAGATEFLVSAKRIPEQRHGVALARQWRKNQSALIILAQSLIEILNVSPLVILFIGRAGKHREIQVTHL